MENLPRTMEDNLAPDHQSATNTNFLEERTQITEQAKHDVSMTLPASVEASMPEDHWMARMQLKKPVLIEQVEWNTTHARDFMLSKFNFPGVLAGIESVVKRTLSMYAFYKLTPVFRVQVNGTMFHQGQLILSFDPFNQACDSVSATTYAPYLSRCDIYYASGLPNVKIMASEVDPAELRVPFVHPRSYLTTNTTDGFDNLGRIRLQVLNPLSAAEGASSSLPVSIWMYALDASVHVPMNYHDVSLPALATPSIGLEGIVDNVAGGAKNTGRMIGNFLTGNFGKMLRNGQGLVDNLGELFGFDYPTRVLAPEKTISPVENMAISVGASRSQRLCLDPVSGYEPDPEIFGTTSNDLDLMRIAKTPMLLAQLKWKTTDAVKTQLATFPVTPMLAPQNIAYSEQTQNFVASNVSYLAYASTLFNFWRGGITFDVEFVATHFHSGRIVAGFVPNNDTSSGTYDNVINSLPNITMDLQQTSKLSFTVPFVSATPLKYVTYDSKMKDDETIIGNLYFYVMNKLSAAANVSAEIEVNIYIRAAEDFQLYVPSNPGLAYKVLGYTAIEDAVPTVSGIEIQSNRTQDAAQTPVASLTLGSGFAPKELRFGESYALVDLIRRFNFLQRLIIKVDTGENPFDFPADPFSSYRPVSPTLLPKGNSLTSDNAMYETMLGNLSRIFSVWSGSIRYKDVSNADRQYNVCYGVVHYPDYLLGLHTFKPSAPGFAFVTTNLAQDSSLEFEVPYYSPYQCLLTKYPPEFQNESLRVTMNGTLASYAYCERPRTSTSVPIYRFHAGGDDFKFAYLRPPGAEYRESIGGTPTQPTRLCVHTVTL